MCNKQNIQVYPKKCIYNRLYLPFIKGGLYISLIGITIEVSKQEEFHISLFGRPRILLADRIVDGYEFLTMQIIIKL